MKNIPTYIVIILISLFTGMMLSYYLTNKELEEAKETISIQEALIEGYNLYNLSCENLLDSMAIKEPTFLDTTGETDEYQFYLETRETLDSLLYYTKDCKN